MDDEDFYIYDSLKRVKVIKQKSIDSVITQSVFLLNIAQKIPVTYISKKLGILIRNLNEEEVDCFYVKVKKQIKEAMSLGFDLLKSIESNYDCSKSEYWNMGNIFRNLKISLDDVGLYFNYIYCKKISLYGCLNADNKCELILNEDFDDIELSSDEIARRVSEYFIVLEVQNYNNIYKIMNRYYSLNNDLYIEHSFTEKFIYNLIKLCNILFCQTDSHYCEEKFLYKIVPIEKYDFEILNFVCFFDGYAENLFPSTIISDFVRQINSDLIDKYISDNKENLNNFVFLISKLYTSDNKYYEFNYKEYNLNLISILELLLVNSKHSNTVTNMFVKNILVCLAINDQLSDFEKEKKIINNIYSYRSCIVHGNYCGYKNFLHNLEKLLDYRAEEYEMSKYNTIEYLISKKLNLYIKSVFDAYSKNNKIVDILKNEK